jgi:hypothetical protein
MKSNTPYCFTIQSGPYFEHCTSSRKTHGPRDSHCTSLRKTQGPRDSLNALENKHFLPLPHTHSLKLLMHPVHCLVTTSAPDLCFTVFMKHKSSPFWHLRKEIISFDHYVTSFLLSNIFFMSSFSCYLCQINACPLHQNIPTEYTSVLTTAYYISCLCNLCQLTINSQGNLHKHTVTVSYNRTN